MKTYLALALLVLAALLMMGMTECSSPEIATPVAPEEALKSLEVKLGEAFEVKAKTTQNEWVMLVVEKINPPSFRGRDLLVSNDGDGTWTVYENTTPPRAILFFVKPSGDGILVYDTEGGATTFR